jgi:hypothetical protein
MNKKLIKYKFFGYSLIYTTELILTFALSSFTYATYGLFYFNELKLLASQIMFWAMFSLFTRNYLDRVYKLTGD